MKPNRTRRLTAIAAALTTALPLMACASETSDSEGITIEAAKYSWSASNLTNTIIDQIAKANPDLGVAGLETKQLDPATAWAGAKRGDIQMITEVALPNQQTMADEAKDKMEIVSKTYTDASQGWFVPKYVVEPGGPAEGLKSIDQLNKYSDVFKGTLYDADPGYVTTKQNKKRLAGYGVKFKQVASGEAPQLAQLKRANQRKEPILVYLYHPHWVFASFDMVQLEEPAPYKEGCLEENGNGACAMPAYSAAIALSKEVMSDAPKFADFIKNFKITIEEMEEMQKAVDIDKEKPEDVAGKWIDEHGDDIKEWVK